jgi:hypothetical protein
MPRFCAYGLVLALVGLTHPLLTSEAQEDAGFAIAPAQDDRAPMAIQTATAPAEPVTLTMEELAAHFNTLKEGQQPETRAASAKVFGRMSLRPIPEPLSRQMAASAVLDPDPEVRTAAAHAIRDLDDRLAKQLLFEAALNPKLDDGGRARGAEAIRVVDDPIVVTAIVRIVTAEIRLGIAQNPTINELFIRTPGPVTDGNPNLAILLPIQLPTLELSGAHGILAYHALGALRTISRQNFGGDKAAWENWHKNWLRMRSIREHQMRMLAAEHP